MLIYNFIKSTTEVLDIYTAFIFLCKTTISIVSLANIVTIETRKTRT